MLKSQSKWVVLWIITILNSIIATSGYSQSVEQTLELGNHQYQNKHYQGAIENYQRVLFFDTAATLNYVHERLANCYFAEEVYEKALFEYNIAFNVENNDSIKNELIFKRVLIYVIQDRYTDAEYELLSLSDSLTEQFAQRKSFFLGLVSLACDSVITAKTHLYNAIQSEDSISRFRIDKAFSKYNPNRPNPTLAQVMSVIIPGAGQFYIGDYKNAANSFILSGALATLFFSTAIKYTFMDAMVSVIPYFQRYYFGGITRAKNGAILKQQEKREKMIAQTICIFNERKTN
jgi:tetratricopeptide (TPR) repeat protein